MPSAVRGGGATSVARARRDFRALNDPAPTIYEFDTNQGHVWEPATTPSGPGGIGRDLGLSSAQGSNVLWVFGDTILVGITGTYTPTDLHADGTVAGSQLRFSTHSHGTTAAAPGSMTTLTDEKDGTSNAPTEFVVSQPRRDANDLRHPLWGDSLIPHPSGNGWIMYYYRVLHRNTPELELLMEASFVADIPSSGHTLTRSGNEVQLWTGPGGFLSGSCLAPDGYIYLYTTDGGIIPTWHEKVARVLHANYKNPAAYEYWNGTGWTVNDRTKAVNISLGGMGHDGMGGFGGISVSWNAFLNKYVMTHAYAVQPADKMCVRVADRPEGPWSRPAKFTVPANPSATYGAYTFRQHQWAQTESGRVIWATYYRGLPATGAFSGELRICRIKTGPDAPPPSNAPPTNIMTTSYVGGWGKKFSDDMDALAPGSTYKPAKGIYEVDLRNHPQNGTYKTAITVPNNITFDFSDCEIRLKPNQQRVTSGGLTSGQFSDIITNRGLGNDANKATNITIIVGCLNGQAAQQGNVGGSSEATNEAWMDGITLIGAQNCTITGSATSPWARTVTATHGDGSTFNIDIRGQVKNVRGWDGGGGRTETFSVTFDEPRSGNVCEYLETFNDDGTTRSCTGTSANTVDDTITINSSLATLVTFRHIYGHHHKSHGATSWRTPAVHRQNSLFENNTGAGFRYEEGYNHTLTDVVSRSNANGSGGSNGLNLKGITVAGSQPSGTTMLTATRLSCMDNDGHAIQINSIDGLVVTGWYRKPSAKSKISQPDNLPSPPAPADSINLNHSGFVAVA